MSRRLENRRRNPPSEDRKRQRRQDEGPQLGIGHVLEELLILNVVDDGDGLGRLVLLKVAFLQIGLGGRTRGLAVDDGVGDGLGLADEGGGGAGHWRRRRRLR